MKIFKFSSVALLTLLMLWVSMPELSAKHHHRRSCTSWGFNFNINPVPRYNQNTYIVQQPVQYERVTYVQPATYVQPTPYYTPTYYPVYREQVVVQRPVYTPRVYVQPQFSYWNY